MLSQFKNMMSLMFIMALASPVYSEGIAVDADVFSFEISESLEIYALQDTQKSFVFEDSDLENRCKNLTCFQPIEEIKPASGINFTNLKLSFNFDFASTSSNEPSIDSLSSMSKSALLASSIQTIIKEPSDLQDYSLGLSLSLSF